jgi:hypothetical protein
MRSFRLDRNLLGEWRSRLVFGDILGDSSLLSVCQIEQRLEYRQLYGLLGYKYSAGPTAGLREVLRRDFRGGEQERIRTL